MNEHPRTWTKYHGQRWTTANDNEQTPGKTIKNKPREQWTNASKGGHGPRRWTKRWTQPQLNVGDRRRTRLLTVQQLVRLRFYFHPDQVLHLSALFYLLFSLSFSLSFCLSCPYFSLSLSPFISYLLSIIWTTPVPLPWSLFLTPFYIIPNFFPTRFYFHYTD